MRDLTAEQRHAFLHGLEETILFSYEGQYGRRSNRIRFSGALEYVRRRHRESTSDLQRQELEAYMSPVPCESCGGKRLRRESLAVTVGGGRSPRSPSSPYHTRFSSCAGWNCVRSSR